MNTGNVKTEVVRSTTQESKVNISQGEEELEFSITKRWNGDAIISAHPVHFTISPNIDGKHVDIKVDAPLFNDPPQPPDVAPGKSCPQLWDYEVVEFFFLGDEEQYLEVELSPFCTGSQMDFFKDGLDLEYISKKDGNRWVGSAKIPLHYFPPNVSMMNAYSIHGSNENREYEALYPATHDFTEPDFHRLQFFKPFQLKSLFPNISGELLQLQALWDNFK